MGKVEPHLYPKWLLVLIKNLSTGNIIQVKTLNMNLSLWWIRIKWRCTARMYPCPILIQFNINNLFPVFQNITHIPYSNQPLCESYTYGKNSLWLELFAPLCAHATSRWCQAHWGVAPNTTQKWSKMAWFRHIFLAQGFGLRFCSRAAQKPIPDFLSLGPSL